MHESGDTNVGEQGTAYFGVFRTTHFGLDISGEKADPKLRADRAHAVAALLPNTASRASVIGAAPAGDFLVPANAAPQDRAMNRSVLIRLPFEELRQAGEVEEYSAGAVGFWRSNPTATVEQLTSSPRRRPRSWTATKSTSRTSSRARSRRRRPPWRSSTRTHGPSRSTSGR